jgi:DNA-binding cell septation regulator SpoVG
MKAWSHIVIHPVPNPSNPNLLATCDFRYHGLQIRGVRLFGAGSGVSIDMPSKKFGDSIHNSVYFVSPVDREMFYCDVVSVYKEYIHGKQD